MQGLLCERCEHLVCVVCVQDVFPDGDLLLGFWSDEVGMDS